MGVQLVLDIPRMPAAEGLGGSSVTSKGHKYEEREGRAHLAPRESPFCPCFSSPCDAIPDKALSQRFLSCCRKALWGLLWLPIAIHLMLRDIYSQDVSQLNP